MVLTAFRPCASRRATRLKKMRVMRWSWHDLVTRRGDTEGLRPQAPGDVMIVSRRCRTWKGMFATHAILEGTLPAVAEDCANAPISVRLAIVDDHTPDDALAA